MLRILRPYGSTEVVEVALRDLTGADYSSVALVAGDVKKSADGAGFTNVTNLPTNSSGQVRWTPASGELNAKSFTLRIRDQDSPAEFIVSDIIIETYGHASSMHPNLGVIGGGGEIDIEALVEACALATFRAGVGLDGYGVDLDEATNVAHITTPAGTATVPIAFLVSTKALRAFGTTD